MSTSTSRYQSLIITALALLSIQIGAYAQDPAVDLPDLTEAPAAQSLIPEIATVRARSGDGKVSRFADRAGREFLALFDAQGRLVAVNATRGRHILDIESIGYMPSGEIAGVVLASGYGIAYSYASDGTQVIRDRYGGVVTRARGSDRGGSTIVHADPSGKLLQFVNDLDALLQAATAPVTK